MKSLLYDWVLWVSLLLHLLPPVTGFAVAPRTVGSSRSSWRTKLAFSQTTANDLTEPQYLAQHNATLSFPPYSDLMSLEQGECVISDKITVRASNGCDYDFCVKLYPRGGGHNSKFTVEQSKGGFGMSYKLLPLFGGNKDEKVGAYLQFLPRSQQDTVDASFALRLLGRQSKGPRFDVEWRSGMRFVGLEESKLAAGRANDFGAHLMQTPMLQAFVGADDDNSESPVEMQVEILLHPPLSARSTDTKDGAVVNDSVFSNGFGLAPLPDMRERTDEPVRVGRVVVPILRRLSERPQLFQQGSYPGVEYRVLRILDPNTGKDLFYHVPGADYELKPIYPLVAALERPWPVRVNEADLPKLYTSGQYNAISAIGSLITAVTGLFTAFMISQAISVFFIPSRSMDPTFRVGDVLLVDKVTPRLLPASSQTGSIVLFTPPQALRDLVQTSGGRLTDRDLFVKRIAAQAGDVLTVKKTGEVLVNGKEEEKLDRGLCGDDVALISRFLPDDRDVTVGPHEVAVLGDCAAVSIDSRVWGPLEKSKIVGRPLWRLWPLERAGPIPTITTSWTED